MTFYGKTFKKVSAQHADNTFEMLGLTEETYGLLRSTDSLCTFSKNTDGSVGFTGSLAGGLVLRNKWYPNQESVFVTATGAVIIIYLKIEDDDVFKFIISLPTGKQLNVDVYFTEFTMKVEFYIPGVDVVTVMYYEAL